MAAFTSDTIGAADEAVRLVLGQDTILVAESWEVHEGILEQPMAWSIRVGWGGVVSQFLNKYPTGTPFQLFLGTVLQATGQLEGRLASGNGGATEIELKGRDALAPVLKNHVSAARTFTNITYADLTWQALLACKVVTGAQSDGVQLKTSNEANRQVKAGRPVRQLKAPRTVDQVIQDEDSGNSEVATQSHVLEAHVGETWLGFLRRYLDPAGLILWAAADGTFVLSEPNIHQAPLYSLVRQPIGATKLGNATSYRFVDDTTHRHSIASAFARGGGRKAGRTKALGSVTDEEMVNPPRLDVQTVLAVRETNCQNTAQAENYCQRKLAEERRQGYQLSYVVPGHTLPVPGGHGAVAVITPDTIVTVTDPELGIAGDFYIESLARRRSPETSTEIRLMRPTDILLGPDT